MGSGFSRERGVEFHPSVKNSILACKIGQAFSLFTIYLRGEGKGAAFSAMVPHVSRMLCFLRVLRGCLSVSRGCSFSCSFENWYWSPVQLACFSQISHHFTRLLEIRAGMRLRSQGWGT